MAKRNQYAFDKKAYDHIHVQVAHGKKAIVQKRAEELGTTINSYINELIRNDLRISESEWKRRETDEKTEEE